MRALVAATTALIAALALTTAAIAGTPISMQPLTDAGYTVGLASQTDATCTTWVIAGHGVSEYINDCDPGAAATIASLDNPGTIYEADWQLQHPDQLQAASAIAALCYSISRTAPQTDSWRIVGGATDTTVDGAGLPGLASSLPTVCGDGNTPTAQVVPGTDANGTTTLPGAPTVTAAIATTAATIAANKAAAAQAAQAKTDTQTTQVAALPYNVAADSTLTDSLSSGDTPAQAALAARSAGLNAVYGV